MYLVYVSVHRLEWGKRNNVCNEVGVMEVTEFSMSVRR